MSDLAPPPDDDQDPDACPNCLNLIGPRTHWQEGGGYTCVSAGGSAGMTEKRCPCGCGLTDASADERYHHGGETFVLLHLAWHRLLYALTLAGEYNLDLAIRQGRRVRRWLR